MSSHKLLSALEVLNSDFDPATLPERAVNAAMRMIGCDLLTFDFFSNSERYEDTAWANNPMVLDPEFMLPFGELLHQHPIVKISLDNPNGDALKITDVVSQAEFERTDLYNEFYRSIGVNKQMGCALLSEGDLTMTYAFTRQQADFTDREKAIASLAAPHFVNAIRNGFAFKRLSTALDAGGSGVIAVDRSGKTTFTSQFARFLLVRYFPGEKTNADGLPETLAAWLRTAILSSRSREVQVPVRPYRIENQHGSLTIRLLDNRQTHEDILLLEEKPPLSPESFSHLPVTKRESEILFWIAQGKTDPEIAILCGISIRTVQKHVENIYTKLGVESRTAALRQIFENLY